MKRKFGLSDLVEAITVGLVCVGIGTFIATTTVRAQNKSAPIIKLAVPRIAETESCPPSKSPDAMCSLPVSNGPNAKVCFGTRHARCFELNDHKLSQTLRGQLANVRELAPEQEASAKAEINEYVSYLSNGLKNKRNDSFTCLHVAIIESPTERREFCLSALPKKEADEKTKNLIASLESPNRATIQPTKSAPTKKQ